MNDAFKIINGRILPSTENTRDMNNQYNYKSCFEVINFSRYNLYICSRDGIITEIKANSKLQHGDVLADYVYIIHSRVTDVETPMRFVDGHEDPELQCIRSNMRNSNHITWKEEINVKELLSNSNHSHYIDSCDMVISVSNKESVLKQHFRCRQVIRNSYIQRMKNLPDYTFKMCIRLIDNDDKIAARWMLLDSIIVQLTPKKDPLLANGIYFNGLIRESIIQNTELSSEDLYFTVEEMMDGKTPFKFFGSKEEAMKEKNRVTDKIMDIQDKDREREHKRDMQQIQNTHEKEIMEHKKRSLELEKRLEEINAELKLAKSFRDEEYERRKYRLEDEHMDRKYRYENKHNDNKATVETIKTISLIITGVLALRSFM